jgi:hypothetical protein
MTPPMNPTYTTEGRARLRQRIAATTDADRLRDTLLQILDMTAPDTDDDVACDRITATEAAILHDGWRTATGTAWSIAQANHGVSAPPLSARLPKGKKS